MDRVRGGSRQGSSRSLQVDISLPVGHPRSPSARPRHVMSGQAKSEWQRSAGGRERAFAAAPLQPQFALSSHAGEGQPGAGTRAEAARQ